MELGIIVQSIIVIALMVGIGALVSRTFPLNEDTRSMLISLIVNVGMPCIILSSIFKVEIDQAMFRTILLVLLLSVLINLAGIGIGWLFGFLFYRDAGNIREMALLSGLGNTGFIGIPLCAILFGPEGALYAAVFDAGVDITIWTVGVVLLQPKGKAFSMQTLRSLFNMPLIAVVLGLLVSYFQLRPPFIADQLVTQLAGIAAPLAMFYIGMLVMTLRGGTVKESKMIWLPITVKLLLLPLLVACGISFYPFAQLVAQIIIVQSMMPTLTMASVLFAKYSADENLGALTTITSTILALFSIPLVVYLLNVLLAIKW